ncbi:hypothetical protein AVEN_253278-1 [Araneus ventricosus]|uniref:Uncharacterized protein n=1 Tax=Araneus ventricosus TaxID=182803 RepID=A0A4Y2T7S2_ARAVE|nr:hypothetical protein AVEN_253278-1 [Araneus ventricosus]
MAIWFLLNCTTLDKFPLIKFVAFNRLRHLVVSERLALDVGCFFFTSKVCFTLSETGTFHGAKVYEDADSVTLGVRFWHLVVGERLALFVGCKFPSQHGWYLQKKYSPHSLNHSCGTLCLASPPPCVRPVARA